MVNFLFCFTTISKKKRSRKKYGNDAWKKERKNSIFFRCKISIFSLSLFFKIKSNLFSATNFFFFFDNDDQGTIIIICYCHVDIRFILVRWKEIKIILSRWGKWQFLSPHPLQKKNPRKKTYQISIKIDNFHIQILTHNLFIDDNNNDNGKRERERNKFSNIYLSNYHHDHHSLLFSKEKQNQNDREKKN